MKKAIKAVIISILLLPFYLTSSQFSLASSDMHVEPIFVLRESMIRFPCFQQQKEFKFQDATQQDLFNFHKYLVFFHQQKNKDAKQGGFHRMNPLVNLSKYMQDKSESEFLKVTGYALSIFSNDSAEIPFGLTELWAKTIQEKKYTFEKIRDLFGTVRISEDVSRKIYDAAVSSSNNMPPQKKQREEIRWIPKDPHLKVIHRNKPKKIIVQTKENEIINGFFVPRTWFAINPITIMIQIGSIGLLPLIFCVYKYIYRHN